jgi:hypothetical protein
MVRAARLAQGFEVELLLARPEPSSVAGLIGSAVQSLAGEPSTIFVLATTGDSLAASLESLDFEARDEFVSLVKRTTRPVAIRNLKPAMAETAVGV